MMTRSMPPIDMPKVTGHDAGSVCRICDVFKADRGHLTLQPVFEIEKSCSCSYHLSERVIGARDDLEIERRSVERREKQIAELRPTSNRFSGNTNRHCACRNLDRAKTPQHACVFFSDFSGFVARPSRLVRGRSASRYPIRRGSRSGP